MDKLNLILFGPPGAGKGTQSDKIIEKYSLTHISTGDLFRKHLGEGTELGKLAQQYMDDGNLVPDQLVIDMVDDRLNQNENSSGYIFDGFPRTIKQSEALDKLLLKFNTEIKLVIKLLVNRDELVNRLLERGKTSGRADDENIEKINTRIQVYEEETLPVANYYETQNKLFKIPGEGSIDSIFGEISNLINNSKN